MMVLDISRGILIQRNLCQILYTLFPIAWRNFSVQFCGPAQSPLVRLLAYLGSNMLLFLLPDVQWTFQVPPPGISRALSFGK